MTEVMFLIGLSMIGAGIFLVYRDVHDARIKSRDGRND